MKVRTRWDKGVLVASLEGEIDTMDSEGMASAMAEISTQKPQAVVLDFGGVKYIASQGIALVIKFAQEVRRGGGQIRIAAVLPAVKTVLDMVNLKVIVPMADSVETAVGELQKQQQSKVRQ